MLGLPKSKELIRLDGESLGEGIPNQLVKSVEWVGWPDEDDEDDEDIRVIDLGEAFTQDAVPERLAQPGDLQAPETIFADRFDYRLDLWRAGLIVRFPPPTLGERLTDICCRSIILRSEYCHSNGLKSTSWLHR